MWLYSTPVAHVTDVTVTTDVDGTTGVVNYAVEAEGAGEVRVRLTDAAGSTVAEASGASGSLSVADATLWQPGAGYLYDLTAEIVDGETVVDAYRLPVGIRTVEVRGAEFLINGEPFYFTGFGKHEDTAVRGKGHDNAYLVHDFELLDWIGRELVPHLALPLRRGGARLRRPARDRRHRRDRRGRSQPLARRGHHRRTGAADVLARHDQRRDRAPRTRSTCASSSRRDKNHPSVVMWCVANEPASQEDGAREYFEPLIALTRELDPSRPVTIANVMFATSETDRVADLLDVLCLNRYYGWYVATGDLATAEQHLRGDLQAWAAKYDKPILMTEYGADTLSGMHSVWDVPWTEEYQRDYFEMYHRVFDSIPAFVGEQVWNFADFETSVGIHRVGGNKKGVFSRDRKPKAAAFALRDRWRAIGNRKPGTQEEGAQS